VERINKNMGMKELISLQSRIKEMLDEEMELFLEPAPESLREILNYYYSQGGKRLRPALLLAVARAFNSDENLVPHALTIELIHTFSLYHDDVIDGAKERRGAPTVHEKWNKATAIVGGDIFHAVIHGHLLSAIQNNRIKKPDSTIKFLTDLIQIVEVKVGNAVIEEMRLSESPQFPSLEASIAITAGKTAPLFAFCASAGAFLADQENVIVESMYEMGWKVGYAFQLLDDLTDYFKSDKDIGGDLREDKKTPLFVLAHQRKPSAVDHYRKKGDSLNSSDIIEFRNEFRDELLEILNWANKEISDARQYLHHIPDNTGKELILTLFNLLETKSSEFNGLI
jgi:geranylgeranyl pyrophosphate synthase